MSNLCKNPSIYTQIPNQVLKKLKNKFYKYDGTPFSFVEISHRSKQYDKLNTATNELIRKYLNANNYICLLMPTGSAMATLYFNFTEQQKETYFYVNGEDSQRCYKQMLKCNSLAKKINSPSQLTMISHKLCQEKRKAVITFDFHNILIICSLSQSNQTFLIKLVFIIMDKITSNLLGQTNTQLFNATKLKPKLSICDFNFGTTYRKKMMGDRKNSLLQIVSSKKQKSQNNKQKSYKLSNENNQMLNQEQSKQFKDQQRRIIRPSHSQNKFPALTKFTVHLEVDEALRQKLSPNKKQVKLNKKSFHQRQLSQNIDSTNDKDAQLQNIEKQMITTKRISQINEEEIEKDFMGKLPKNFSIHTLKLSEEASIQNQNPKKKINPLNVKLKEAERRSKLLISYIERKQQVSPYQLITQKLKAQKFVIVKRPAEKILKSQVKQEIMKNFRTKRNSLKQQNYVTGWNTHRHQPIYEDYQF